MAIYSDQSYTTCTTYSTCTRCGRQIEYGAPHYGEWLCKHCTPARQSPIPGIDAQLDSAERRVMELLAKKEEMAKFDLDFEVDDAILFKRSFNGRKT